MSSESDKHFGGIRVATLSLRHFWVTKRAKGGLGTVVPGDSGCNPNPKKRRMTLRLDLGLQP